MPVAVDADLVACRCDLGCERGQLLDLLADEEERRRGSGALELPQHGRGSFAVRAVVERQRDPVRLGEPPRDADQPRHRRQDRCRSRRAPRRRARRHLHVQPASAACQDERCRGTQVAEARRLRPTSGERALERCMQLGAGLDDVGEPVAPEGLVVLTNVPASPAVRDDRAAAEHRLEHRQTAGRMDERISCGEPLPHHLGEPLDLHAWLACELPRERCTQLVVSSRSGTRHARPRSRAPRPLRLRCLRRPSHRPETRTIVSSWSSPSTRRASACDRGS